MKPASHGCALTFLLAIAFAVLSAACSVPILETPACTEARAAANAFYAFHFGNEMRFSPENLELRARFLTPELYRKLENSDPNTDVFTTGTIDIPKAFRVGTCETAVDDSARVQILLFWRDDVRSEQRAIFAKFEKRAEAWLLDTIDP